MLEPRTIPLVQGKFSFNIKNIEIIHNIYIYATLYFIRISDINEFTWIPDKYFNQAESSETNILYDIPQIEIHPIAGSRWFTEVFNKVKGVNPKSNEIVAVEVSLNGQDWSTQNLHFSYTQIPEVYRVFPTHGPSIGNLFNTVFKPNNISL